MWQTETDGGGCCVFLPVMCLLAWTYTHTYTQRNVCGEEIPKAHYVCCRSFTQAKGLNSFGF